MELTREEITETICEMERALELLRQLGYGTGPTYIALWRRMMRLEEKLYKHPY